MSRFVDRGVERLSLGPCRCEGTPHGEDWADVRKALSGAEWYLVATGDSARGLSAIVVDWSLTDDDGEPVPVTVETLAALDLDTFKVIDGWAGKHLTFPQLPNASAAPSDSGSRGSGSQTRKTRTRR